MTAPSAHRISSDTPGSTEKLAEVVGRQLKGGEIIELIGDVGTGKTTFVRGLARGIGSPDIVASPTFTVSKIYNSDKISLRHYDFYRLADLEIIKQELAEAVEDSKNSVVLEWADEVQNAINPDHIRIKISVTGETSRQIEFSFPEKYKYLGEAL